MSRLTQWPCQTDAAFPTMPEPVDQKLFLRRTNWQVALQDPLGSHATPGLTRATENNPIAAMHVSRTQSLARQLGN